MKCPFETALARLERRGCHYARRNRKENELLSCGKHNLIKSSNALNPLISGSSSVTFHEIVIQIVIQKRVATHSLTSLWLMLLAFYKEFQFPAEEDPQLAGTYKISLSICKSFPFILWKLIIGSRQDWSVQSTTRHLSMDSDSQS